jgi:hypothetical protein
MILTMILVIVNFDQHSQQQRTVVVKHREACIQNREAITFKPPTQGNDDIENIKSREMTIMTTLAWGMRGRDYIYIYIYNDTRNNEHICYRPNQRPGPQVFATSPRVPRALLRHLRPGGRMTVAVRAAAAAAAAAPMVSASNPRPDPRPPAESRPAGRPASATRGPDGDAGSE